MLADARHGAPGLTPICSARSPVSKSNAADICGVRAFPAGAKNRRLAK
jgi:hypothetical protein